jgi:hypothetical protein
VARYRGRRRDDAAARARLRELAELYRRYGYLRLHVLLRKEGLVVNRKRTYRLYCEERLAVRQRKQRRLPGRVPHADRRAGPAEPLLGRRLRRRQPCERPPLPSAVPGRRLLEGEPGDPTARICVSHARSVRIPADCRRVIL